MARSIRRMNPEGPGSAPQVRVTVISVLPLCPGSALDRGYLIPHSPILRLRSKSLVRGILLSVGAFLLALRLAGFPSIENLHGSRWQILALAAAAWGMAETARCLQRRWSLYHAGVLILLWADMMILAVIVAMLTLS